MSSGVLCKRLAVLGLTLSTFLVFGYWWTSSVAAQSPLEWTEPRPISLETEHAECPALAVDASGAVHAFWSGRRVEQASEPQAILYARYQGGEWTQPADILLSPGGETARFPRPIVDDAGRIHLFWSAPGVGGAFELLYHSWAPVNDAMSARNWQPPTQIADGTYQSDVAMDPQGRLHLVYASVSDGTGICHVVSEDNGDTWGPRTCLPRAATVREDEHEVRPRLAIDSRGYLHVVWVLDDYSPLSRLGYSGRAVYYARSTDGGASWSDMIPVDEVDSRDETYEGSQPEWGNVAVDNEDRVHIVWIGTTGMWRYHQWSNDGGITWSPTQVAIPAGGYNNWQGIAVDGDGTLHLVWPSLGELIYTRWDGSNWATPVSIEGDVGGAHHAQAVIVLGNELHVVWQNHGGGRLSPQSPGRIVHAMMLTGAQRKDPQPLPAVPTQVQPTPAATIERRVEPITAPTVRPTLTSVGPSAAAANSTMPLLIGLLPTVVLVGLVFLFRIRKI